MTDPNVLAGLAALRAAREAWPWLADLVEAGPIDRRRTRRLSPAAAVRHDQLVRAERRERISNERVGIRPVGASPVPVNLGVIDVQVAALAAVTDQAWIVTSALRRRGWAYVYHHQTGPAQERWEAATIYLGLMLAHMPLPLAGRVARELERVDAAIRSAAGVGPAWRVVHANCPSCQVRVKAEVSDPDPAVWVVRCDNPECTCRGLLCGCKQPEKAQQYGRHHWWSGRAWAAEHGPLALPIQRGDVGLWCADGWYCTADEVALELNLCEPDADEKERKRARAIVYRWGQRSLVKRVRRGRVTRYRFEDCELVERNTRMSTRGRKRAA